VHETEQAPEAMEKDELIEKVKMLRIENQKLVERV